MNSTKLAWSAVPWEAMSAVCSVLCLGNAKHGHEDWRNAEHRDRLFWDAAMRHLIETVDGDTPDADDGVSHLAHVAANVLILLERRRMRVVTTEDAVGEFLSKNGMMRREWQDDTHEGPWAAVFEDGMVIKVVATTAFLATRQGRTARGGEVPIAVVPCEEANR